MSGTGGQHSKTGQYTQSVNASYGVYSNMISALYKEANHRGYDPSFRDQWVSNEFAQLNKNIYGKFEEIAVDRAGSKNINFAISEYFESRGLKIASNNIQKDWISYEHSSKLPKEAFKN
ncbi:MAG: hypothetical protein U1E78_13170 [Gammaproteobacteria bacterium]